MELISSDALVFEISHIPDRSRKEDALAVLGIADGIYAQSPLYLIRCVFWGAFGGAGGCAIFLLLRHLFSAFWSPLPQWTILGAVLGFSIFMGIGLAKKPGIDEQPQKHENRLL